MTLRRRVAGVILVSRMHGRWVERPLRPIPDSWDHLGTCWNEYARHHNRRRTHQRHHQRRPSQSDPDQAHHRTVPGGLLNDSQPAAQGGVLADSGDEVLQRHPGQLSVLHLPLPGLDIEHAVSALDPLSRTLQPPPDTRPGQGRDLRPASPAATSSGHLPRPSHKIKQNDWPNRRPRRPGPSSTCSGSTDTGSDH
jgi:hypothetical protein